MSRRSHPKKEVEEAVRYAEDNGWRVEVGGALHGERFFAPTIILIRAIRLSNDPIFHGISSCKFVKLVSDSPYTIPGEFSRFTSHSNLSSHNTRYTVIFP